MGKGVVRLEERIELRDRVLLNYRVFADEALIDVSKEPVWIVVSEGRFLKPVEEALLGRRQGEKVVVLVPPEEHYGKYDPKKLKLVPAERFPPTVKPGDTVFLQDDYGIPHPARVRKRDYGTVLVDFNHPLAGKVLRFEVEILRVEKSGSEQGGAE